MNERSLFQSCAGKTEVTILTEKELRLLAVAVGEMIIESKPTIALR